MKLEHDLEYYLKDIPDGAFKDKIMHSVQVVQKAEKIAKLYDPDNGFYLAFSAGKDSQALYHITELAGVTFKAHMNLTSVDPPEVIRFAKRSYPEVELIAPKKSIYQIAIEKQILPSQKIRWCCAEFKESAGAGKVTLIGIRREESTRRAKRNTIEVSSRAFSSDSFEEFEEFRKKRMSNNRIKKMELPTPSVANPDAVKSEQIVGCITGKESILVSPIIDWTEKDVWRFLNEVIKVPHCSLYDEGWKRLGCIGCPMSSAKHKIKENKRWPHVKERWLWAISQIRRGGYSQQLPTGVEWNRKANTGIWGEGSMGGGISKHKTTTGWGGISTDKSRGFQESPLTQRAV